MKPILTKTEVAINALTQQRLQAEHIIKEQLDTWNPRPEVVRQAEGEVKRLESVLLMLRGRG